MIISSLLYPVLAAALVAWIGKSCQDSTEGSYFTNHTEKGNVTRKPSNIVESYILKSLRVLRRNSQCELKEVSEVYLRIYDQETIWKIKISDSTSENLKI